MTSPAKYELSAVDLSGSRFIVEQTGRDENFRPEYAARDVTGDTLLRARYRMYESPDEFRFVDADDEDVVTVTAEGDWDVAGDYLVRDAQTDDPVVVLDNDLSLAQDTWRIRDPDDRSLLAEVESRGGLVTLGRKLLPFGGWIGHEYAVTDASGGEIGTIGSEFAMFDEYGIELSDPNSIPPDPIVIAAIVVDGIQGN